MRRRSCFRDERESGSLEIRVESRTGKIQGVRQARWNRGGKPNWILARRDPSERQQQLRQIHHARVSHARGAEDRQRGDLWPAEDGADDPPSNIKCHHVAGHVLIMSGRVRCAGKPGWQRFVPEALHEAIDKRSGYGRGSSRSGPATPTTPPATTPTRREQRRRVGNTTELSKSS